MQLIIDKKRYLAALWLILVALALVFSSYRIMSGNAFDSDISALLPKPETPALDLIDRQLKAGNERQLLVLLRSDQTDVLKQAEAFLVDALEPIAHHQNLDGQIDRHRLLQDHYSTYQNRLLTQPLRQRFEQQSPEAIAELAVRDLLTPGAGPINHNFAQDPFNLSGHWITSTLPTSKVLITDLGLELEDKTGNWLMLNFELKASPYDVASHPVLSQSFDALVQRFDSVEVVKSGLAFHASYGASLARHEINTVGFGSLIITVLLVLWVFRCPQPFFGVMLTLFSAVLTATAVCFLVFDQVHIITLAFGSTLLGIAVDYCFHFMLKAQQLYSSLRARKLLAPALTTSALSTIGAYLLQLMTPFPALQQIAVFCSAGMLGSWLGIICMGPFYRPRLSRAVERNKRRFNQIVKPCYSAIYRNHSLTVALICGLFLFAATSLQQQRPNDDLSSLNTSSDALLAGEAKVSRLLDSPSISRYFIVEGHSVQDVLERQESLIETLDNLRQRQLIHELLGAARFIPSLKQQTFNQDLVNDKLLKDKTGLWHLCQLLDSDCKKFHQQLSVNQPALEYTQGLEILQQLQQASLAISQQGERFFAPVLMHANPILSDRELLQRTEHLDGIYYVNRVAGITDQLANMRQAVSLFLVAALALLGLILIWRYGRGGVRIILPVCLAACISVSIASLGEGITLFHLFAVLLVLGISLDNGIFYGEVGLNHQTWLASSLSSATSVLAFGLLSMSQVPILEQFGQVVFWGILTAWLLTPLFFAKDLQSTSEQNASQG